MHRKMVLKNTQVHSCLHLGEICFTCPLILSAVLLQLPCPSALQTHPHKLVQPIELYSVSLPCFPEGSRCSCHWYNCCRRAHSEKEEVSDTVESKRKVTPWQSYMIYPHIYDDCLNFFLLARWSWSLHISSQ